MYTSLRYKGKILSRLKNVALISSIIMVHCCVLQESDAHKHQPEKQLRKPCCFEKEKMKIRLLMYSMGTQKLKQGQKKD